MGPEQISEDKMLPAEKGILSETFSTNFMVTTKQKVIVNTQKKTRKESKLNTKESYQATSAKQMLRSACGTTSRIGHMLGQKNKSQ